MVINAKVKVISKYSVYSIPFFYADEGDMFIESKVNMTIVIKQG